MSRSDFSDAFGNKTGTFRQYPRSSHLPGIKFKRNGQPRRVGDDHIRLGNSFHHALPGHFHLNSADARFDLGIAIGLLAFILDLLFGHFQIFFVLPALVEKIQRSQAKHRQADKKTKFQGHPADKDQDLTNFLLDERRKCLDVAFHYQVGNAADEKNFYDRFEQFNHRFERHEAFHS